MRNHKLGDLVHNPHVNCIGYIVNIVRIMETGRLEYDVVWNDNIIVAYDSREITVMKRRLEKECMNIS